MSSFPPAPTTAGVELVRGAPLGTRSPSHSRRAHGKDEVELAHDGWGRAPMCSFPWRDGSSSPAAVGADPPVLVLAVRPRSSSPATVGVELPCAHACDVTEVELAHDGRGGAPSALTRDAARIVLACDGRGRAPSRSSSRLSSSPVASMLARGPPASTSCPVSGGRTAAPFRALCATKVGRSGQRAGVAAGVELAHGDADCAQGGDTSHEEGGIR